MESTQENGSDCNMNGKTSVPWSSETNWVIAHGSLEASVTVDSLDYPIAEPNPETTPRNWPLVLKPPVPDSGPCEIKICFDQKYDVGQIYVRSTARVFEVYYAHSPHSSNEYLCTVKCGVAERVEKLLQTSCIEDVVEEHIDCLSGEITEETIADGENIVTSEDDWVKIKVPEVVTSFVQEKINNTNRVENVQDLYEATAQISDADPCSVLTIRLLSLQDKGLVYVDEIYVFVDPVESTDSGNEEVLAGSSTQSSLMAMFVPTLLQLSKSSVRQVQDKHASDEVYKNNKMESGSRRTDETDVGSEINQVNEQYVKPKELEKDTFKEPVTKYVEPVNITDSPPGHLEIALEHLISRASRVEDICLRLEEKLMKPIQSIEARLQRVEHQLQKLADNSNYYGFPHCTRISAPTFSYSESLSSSFHNEQSDFPACGASELEKKDLSCNNTPELSHDANFHPGLIVSAPEFPCDDDEEINDDLEPPKESPCVEPKKTLSVDDALAAALNGFLSTAIIHPSDNTQATSGLSYKIDEENQYQENAESCQTKTHEFPSAENVNRDSLRHGQVLPFRTPEFNEEEIGNDKHLNYTQTSLGIASDIKNDFESSSSSHVDLPAAFQVNTIDGYFESDNNFNSVETSIDSKPGQDKDSVEAGENGVDDIDDKPNPGKANCFNPDDDDAMVSKQVLEHISESLSEDVERNVAEQRCFKDIIPNVSESSCASMLDFEFPILEVKFTSDVCVSTKFPLEALLDGAAASNTEVPSIDDGCDGDGYKEQINAVLLDGNEKTDLLAINDLLIDTGVSVADGSSNLEGGSQNLRAPNGPEMNVSLI